MGYRHPLKYRDYFQDFSLPAGKSIGVVCGSGGCGIHSFAGLLKTHPGVLSYHEFILCPWDYCEKNLAQNMFFLKKVLSDRLNVSYAFMSGNYFLPYVEKIIEILPDVKIVCLQANKEKTCEHLFNKMRIGSPFQNLFTDYNSMIWKQWKYMGGVKYFCYPHFKCHHITAIDRYYDYYYKIAKITEKSFPDNFKIFQIEDIFKSKEKQIESLNFLKIQNPEPLLEIGLNI